MRRLICIFSCIVIILGILSCSKEEKEIITGSFKVRYYLSSYFVPQSIQLSSHSRNESNEIYLDSKEKTTKANNPTEYLKLSTEYGETGEKEFWTTQPPYSQPYGISQMKVFLLKQGQKIDISESAMIGFVDCSNVILSKYSDMNEKIVRKRISELSTHDLKWLREYFSISHTIKEDGDYYLVITLESGKELSVQLKF